MKNIARGTVFIASVLAVIVICAAGTSYGQRGTGTGASIFSLKDTGGQAHDLTDLQKKSMVILYFFDAESRPSQEGLLNLHHLSERHEEAELTVWAITLSPREKASKLLRDTGITFPILLDDADVSRTYGAEVVLPTVYILGPSLMIVDSFQGGGKTTEAMLVRVAERELQRKQTKLATAISDHILKKNPDSIEAKKVSGYAALEEGDLDRAEVSFSALAEQGKEGSTPGKEGLAAVYAARNQTAKALELVEEVKKESPGSSRIFVTEGDILYAQKKMNEAKEAYQQAVRNEEAEGQREAAPFNRLARIHAQSGQYEKARKLFNDAIAIDPWYITGTTNKGLTYEKEGDLDKALETYRQALEISPDDTFATVLARKAEELINLKRDVEKKKRVDQLVKDLAARFREQQETPPPAEDDWTSRPMVMTFIDFQEKGGLAERDGLSTVLIAQLTDTLNASGRVRVIERVIIERLLEELNLGSSDLADPDTALKLGKVLAAKIIVTGSIFNLPQGSLLSFRLVDTETSAIPQVTTWQIPKSASLKKELFTLNRNILKTVISSYPLRGFVVTGSDDRFIINLGADQGIVAGTEFDVIEDQEPLIFKGKVLRASPKIIARLEVVSVEPGLSHVRVVQKTRPVSANDKIQERLEDTSL